MVFQKLMDFFVSARRVLLVSKKPEWKEFSAMAKVTAVGVIIIGVIGFIVLLVFALTGLGK